MNEKIGKNNLKLQFEDGLVLPLEEVFLAFHQIVLNKISYNSLHKYARGILSTFLNTPNLQ